MLWGVGLACLLALSSGCLEPPGESTAQPGSETPTAGPPWIEIFFTNPKSPSADSYRGGPDKNLAEAIDQSRLSVDIAAFDLNLWSVRDALIRAKKRGVTVRMVTESDNLDEQEIQDIKEAGIPVLGDRREGLMHNKFVVIDRAEVWTGSMNYTTTDGYLNNNNLVRIRSAKMAENYTTEFKEMFEDDLFGPDTRADTPYPKLEIEGSLVETYFSPDDHTASHLIELVNQAKQSVYFLAYSFTSDELADAMLSREQAGVTVAGVFEESQIYSNIGSEYDRLLQAGIDVRKDGNPHNMHDKVIIIDEAIVVTGSYNFSASAEQRNDENTIILHDTSSAAQFLAQFMQIFEDGHR